MSESQEQDVENENQIDSKLDKEQVIWHPDKIVNESISNDGQFLYYVQWISEKGEYFSWETKDTIEGYGILSNWKNSQERKKLKNSVSLLESSSTTESDSFENENQFDYSKTKKKNEQKSKIATKKRKKAAKKPSKQYDNDAGNLSQIAENSFLQNEQNDESEKKPLRNTSSNAKQNRTQSKRSKIIKSETYTTDNEVYYKDKFNVPFIESSFESPSTNTNFVQLLCVNNNQDHKNKNNNKKPSFEEIMSNITFNQEAKSLTVEISTLSNKETDNSNTISIPFEEALAIFPEAIHEYIEKKVFADLPEGWRLNLDDE